MDNETLTDYITGKEIPNIGAEENRQAVERFLVDEKGYSKEDILVDVPVEFNISGEQYKSRIDLAVSLGGTLFMAVKCAAGSLGSREREIVSAARLACSYQIPLSIVSDGKTAIVMDTVSGKEIGRGMSALFSKAEALEKLASTELQPLSEKRAERTKLVFRSYDSMNVNRASVS